MLSEICIEIINKTKPEVIYWPCYLKIKRDILIWLGACFEASVARWCYSATVGHPCRI